MFKIAPLVLLVPSLLFLSSESEARSSGKPRTEKIEKIIIHSIGGPACRNGRIHFDEVNGKNWLKWFNDQPVLGIHYVIDKQGAPQAGVPEDQIANHAFGHNANSIGIELVNNGDGKDLYTDSQISKLAALSASIKLRWGGHVQVKTHASVDHRTFKCDGKNYDLKVDPGVNFPMTKFKTLLARFESSAMRVSKRVNIYSDKAGTKKSGHFVKGDRVIVINDDHDRFFVLYNGYSIGTHWVDKNALEPLNQSPAQVW